MKVILISGKARSGKDYVGEIFKKQLEERGKKVIIAHYADLVKYVLTMFLDWDGKKDDAGRHLLQTVGTDIVRAKKKNYWVSFIIDMADFFGEKWDYMIIPDTRFRNEIWTWEYAGYDAVSVLVKRSSDYQGLSGALAEHISETELDDFNFDFHVNNSETPGETEEQVSQVINSKKYEKEDFWEC